MKETRERIRGVKFNSRLENENAGYFSSTHTESH